MPLETVSRGTGRCLCSIQGRLNVPVVVRLADEDSGTTGMPKGVPFPIDRGYDVGVGVSYQNNHTFSGGLRENTLTINRESPGQEGQSMGTATTTACRCTTEQAVYKPSP